MAGENLNRIAKFYGGITINDRDKNDGVALNFEELDIFSNPSYIQPETVLATNSTDNTNVASGTPRRIWAYTQDDAGALYALSDDAAATPKAKIWRILSATTDTPGNYVAYFTSAQDARGTGGGYMANMIWHGIGDPISSARLYYVVGTNSLYYYGDIKTSPSETSVGTLSGLSATSPYVPMIRVSGEVFIGHGQFIARVDGSGAFTEQAFTLPNEWECVDFAPRGDLLVILARNVRTKSNESRMFYWDKTATTGVEEEVIIPMGGPQGLENHNEIIRVLCAKDSILRAYEVPSLAPFKTHEIDCGNATETDGYIVYPNSIFVKGNIMYFGLARGVSSNKSGLYAIGHASDSLPLAMTLAKRYATTASLTTNSHQPFAAIAVGPNIFASYKDRNPSDTYVILRVEENNSPTRSSNAIYESVWIDGGSPESFKEWPGIFLVARSMPSSCNIKFDARVDNASSYNSTLDADSNFTLSSSNDTTFDGGSTADTFWQRSIESLTGRALQVKLTFTSSGTSKAQLYSVGILSRIAKLI